MVTLSKFRFQIILLVLCAVMATYIFISRWSTDNVQLDSLGPAPDFTLQDLDGHSVKLSDSSGKVRVIYFYFTNCPDVCPPTTLLLSDVQNKLKETGLFGKQVQFISISFDSKKDTPERIREFIQRIPNPIDQSGWTFLRGTSDEQLKKLMTDFNLALLRNEETGSYTHTDTVTIVDQQGTIRKYMSGSIDDEASVEGYLDVIDALLEE